MVYKPHHSLQTSLRRFLFCLLSFTTHNPNAIEVELLVTDPDRNIQEVQNHFLTSAGRFSPRKKREKEAASALPDIVTVHPIDEHISPQIQKVYSRCCHRHLAVLLLLHDLQPILLIPKASTFILRWWICCACACALCFSATNSHYTAILTVFLRVSSCACTRGFVGSFHLGNVRDLTPVLHSSGVFRCIMCIVYLLFRIICADWRVSRVPNATNMMNSVHPHGISYSVIMATGIDLAD